MTRINLLEIIGKNIKEARIEIAMKGETLGKALNCDKGYISQMENGMVDFKISRLQQIAEILQTDVCHLSSVNTIHSAKEFQSIAHRQKTFHVDSTVIVQLLDEIKILNARLKKNKS